MGKKITVIPANRTKGAEPAQEKKKLHVAAYCRVSTEQEEQLGSLANQVQYYTAFINSNPDYELVDIFADEGISGTNTRKREGFQKLIKACDEGKVDLVCPEYCRLPSLFQTLEKPWNTCHVREGGY